MLFRSSSKTLIITEGATDWRHIKAAIHALSQIKSTKALCEMLDIEFLEFDHKNSNESGSLIKLEMCNTTLCRMCEEYAKIKQQRKLIFIADRDDKDTNKKLGGECAYKKWGNNVYSVILPIPAHRKTTPDICIEHYYSDDEIKTPVIINGISRRLYMVNEFDAHGRCLDMPVICEKKKICGPDKIGIIEGSQGEKVLSTTPGKDDNLALSKMQFAIKVLNKEPPFSDFNFGAFKELLMIINDINQLPLE